jgi:hypothetical protein
LEGIPPN